MLFRKPFVFNHQSSIKKIGNLFNFAYSSQAGIAHIVLMVLLVIGVLTAVLMVQNRTNILPHASEDQIPVTGFSLDLKPLLSEPEKAKPMGIYYPGEMIEVDVKVSSDIEETNTFLANIAYPKDLLEVSEIIKELPFDGQKEHPRLDSFLYQLIYDSQYNKDSNLKDNMISWKGDKLNVGVHLEYDRKLTDFDAKKYDFEVLSDSETYKGISETYKQIDGFVTLKQIQEMEKDSAIRYIAANLRPSLNSGEARTQSTRPIETDVADACSLVDLACPQGYTCQSTRTCPAGSQSCPMVAAQAKCVPAVNEGRATVFPSNFPSPVTLIIPSIPPLPSLGPLPSGFVVERDVPLPTSYPPGYIPSIPPLPSITPIHDSSNRNPDQNNSDQPIRCDANMACPQGLSCQPFSQCVDGGACTDVAGGYCVPTVTTEIGKTASNYFIQIWLPETGFNNEVGEVTLSGGVQGKGIMTSPSNKPIMATIVFKAKKIGHARIELTDKSAMFGSATGTKLFPKNKNVDIDIKDPNNPNPSPDNTYRNLSEENRDRMVGDLNGDGIVDMADFSKLLSSWGSRSQEADINHDGSVNIYDFSIFITHLTK